MSLFDILVKKKAPVAIGPWPDNLPLVEFGRDKFTLRDAKQDVLILGEKGSGKTSGSGHLFARKYLEHGFGGLVVCFSPDDVELWRGYLKEAGRESDGRFFSDYRFNFLDYEAKIHGADFVDNVVTLLTDVASIKSRGQTPDVPYWPEQKRKLIRNAITILQLAGQPIAIRSLYKLIQSAPGSLRQAGEEEWRKASSMFQTLSQAARRNGSNPDYLDVKDYWMKELPMLRDVTQATIRSDFTGMFDPLSKGKIGQLFGTTTNLTPDEIFDGKVIVVDFPVSTLRDIGQYAALIWIQLVQRAIDRRAYTPPYDRPVFIWEDEAHYFTIDQDALFQTTSRKKGVSVVRLTQNIPNFLDAYGRDGKHKVNTLLGGHVLKIFHRNGDPETNEWAARVIAKRLTAKHSLSMSDGKASASVSETWEDSCPPSTFKGLLNGGEENGKVVEGIVFQSGRIWKTMKEKAGKKKKATDWMKMKFRQ